MPKTVLQRCLHTGTLEIHPGLLGRSLDGPLQSELSHGLSGFELDYWGARRGNGSACHAHGPREITWPAEQPRRRAWVQLLGSARALLDAGGDSDERWLCQACGRWGPQTCPACGADLRHAAKRRRSAAPSTRARVAAHPLGALLGHVAVEVCIAPRDASSLVVELAADLSPQLSLIHI